MGFMDKMKQQASALAEKAQEGAKVGQERLSQLQAKRQSDAMLLELGGLVYLSRTGRAPEGAEVRIDELVSRLGEHEAENGPVSVTGAGPDGGTSGTFVPSGAGSSDAAPAPEQQHEADPGEETPPATGGIPRGSFSSDEEAPGS